MNKNEITFEQIVEKGCGIDVHKKVIVATIRGIGIKEMTRSFNAFTASIEELRDWLKEYGITHVAMESTGVYWKPIFNICLLYTSPSPRDGLLSRMPSSA